MRGLKLASWLPDERERISDTLMEWVRIPSIAAFDHAEDDLRKAANFATDQLSSAHLRRVEIIETGGAPAVYGEWPGAGPSAPTVLVYGHYDVHPAAPLAEWDRPPFSPAVVEETMYGRGVGEGKGPVLAMIEAVRGSLSIDGHLPVNIKFFLEGGRTTPGSRLRELIEQHRERLACDVIVVPGPVEMGSEPSTVCGGIRGLLELDVDIRTSDHDVHSGHFGGSVLNPAHLLAGLIDDIHDGSGRIQIPGFYHRVRTLTDSGREVLAKLALDPEAWRAQAGVETLAGEQGLSVLEQVGVRPTCDVVRVVSGNRSQSTKTVIPAVASATFAFRLVPDQVPREIEAAFRSWAEARVSAGATVTIGTREIAHPYIAPFNDPAFEALVVATKRARGGEPVIVRHGGGGPPDPLRLLGAPILLLGVGRPSHWIQAPNEHLPLERLWSGVHTGAQLLVELGGRVSPGSGASTAVD